MTELVDRVVKRISAIKINDPAYIEFNKPDLSKKLNADLIKQIASEVIDEIRKYLSSTS